MSRVGSIPVLVVVALVLLTAGCVTVPSDDGSTPTPAELEAEIAAAEPPRTATATLESTHVVDGETATYEDVMWMHADGRTAVEATTGDGERYTNVDDGEYAWFYDHGADRVTVLDSEQTGESHFEYLYDEQRQYFEDLDATAVEEATVDGRETYHVTFEPPSEDDANERTITVLVGDTEYVVPLGTTDGSEDADTDTDDALDASEHATPAVERIDVWIDQETLFPVKQELSTEDADRTWTYADLELDADVSADRFAFEPPADAVVEKDVFPTGTPVDTVADAEDVANVSVAEPAWLPDDLEREDADLDPDVEVAQYFFDDVREVTIRYADDGRSIVLAVSAPERPHSDDEVGESVTIGDHSGYQIESQFGTQLLWTCDGQGYYLFGTEEFDADDVRNVAESIGCQ